MTHAPRLRLAILVTALALIASVTPSGAWARQSMSFTPGDRTRAHAASSHRWAARHTRHPAHVARSRGHGDRRRTAADGDEGSAAVAVPGAGFTMENGVLTYPAPARFQPKNLKHNQ